MSNRGNPPIYQPPNPNLGLVIEREAYKAKGGSISCGHDKWVWNQLKTAKGGEMFLCNMCGQYLAVLLGLPWVSQRRIGYSNKRYPPETNHLDGKWLHPVEARISAD
jgi:hypothetical protein